MGARLAWADAICHNGFMDIHHLYSHAGFPSRAIDEMWVEVVRPTPNRLDLRFIAAGRIAEILLPDPSDAGRADELWRTTCFEAFIRSVGEQGYRELNFSPSRRWAAYEFDGYRAGMREAALITPLRITLDIEVKRMVQDVSLELDLGDGPSELGLSAIIETRGGAKSYWALIHPANEPDFHNPACFAADLPPPDKA